MRGYGLLFSMMLFMTTAQAGVYDVTAFGAVGDGVADDGEAIRKAIACAATNGEPSVLFFPKRVYRLGGKRSGHAHLPLKQMAHVTVEGNRSTFLVHPAAPFATLTACTNVIFRGCIVEYEPRSFTQGTIRDVDAAAGSFQLDLQQGYPLLMDPSTNRIAMAPWQWGVVFDPVERHRKWDVGDHFFMESAERMEGQSSRVTIRVAPTYKKGLQAVRPGDRFALPLKTTADGKGTQASNFNVEGSTGCLIEDITFYGGGNGMVFGICRNEGRITLRRIVIAHKPGSDSLWSTWRDGMHCKDNRLGPIIEDCYFEGMQDDSINLGANTAMAVEQVSSNAFLLVGADFKKGDRVLAFNMSSGEALANTCVADAQRNKKGLVVTLEAPVDIGIVLGSKRPHLDIRATHFYNASYASDGYEVRRCTFKPQRRHAMLIRSSNGIIENNLVDQVGGSAVHMSNELGSFYEGPFPRNNVIRNNTITNTRGVPIDIYSAVFNLKAHLVGNHTVSNNVIRVRSDQTAIRVRSCNGLVLENNRIYPLAGNTPLTNAVSISHSSDIRMK